MMKFHQRQLALAQSNLDYDYERVCLRNQTYIIENYIIVKPNIKYNYHRKKYFGESEKSHLLLPSFDKMRN